MDIGHIGSAHNSWEGVLYLKLCSERLLSSSRGPCLFLEENTMKIATMSRLLSMLHPIMISTFSQLLRLVSPFSTQCSWFLICFSVFARKPHSSQIRDPVALYLATRVLDFWNTPCLSLMCWWYVVFQVVMKTQREQLNTSCLWVEFLWVFMFGR